MTIARAALFAAWLVAGNAAAQTVVPPFADTIEQRMQACFGCHGDRGGGVPDAAFPRLAGQPADYLAAQMQAFRDGVRTYAPMNYLMARQSDAYFLEIAEYFAAQVPDARVVDARRAAPLDRASYEAGRALVHEGRQAAALPACTACHGPDLAGTMPGIPALAGMPRDFLIEQVGSWKSGSHRSPEPNCMAQIAKRMSGADIVAAATWLSLQQPDQRPTARTGSAAARVRHAVRSAVRSATRIAVRSAGRTVAAIVILAIAGAGGFWWSTRPAPDRHDDPVLDAAVRALDPVAGDDPVDRGRYLAIAGDLHRLPSGARWCGIRGRPRCAPPSSAASTRATSPPIARRASATWTADDILAGPARRPRQARRIPLSRVPLSELHAHHATRCGCALRLPDVVTRRASREYAARVALSLRHPAARLLLAAAVLPRGFVRERRDARRGVEPRRLPRQRPRALRGLPLAHAMRSAALRMRTNFRAA